MCSLRCLTLPVHLFLETTVMLEEACLCRAETSFSFNTDRPSAVLNSLMQIEALRTSCSVSGCRIKFLCKNWQRRCILNACREIINIVTVVLLTG